MYQVSYICIHSYFPLISVSIVLQGHAMTRGTSSRLDKFKLLVLILSTPTAFTTKTRRRRAQSNMKTIARLILSTLHAFYTFWTLFAFYVRLARKSAPRPLEYPRRQTPKHLALVLVTEDGRLNDEESYICNTVVDVVGWCRTVGIESLSVYNRQGMQLHSICYFRRSLKLPSHRRTL